MNASLFMFSLILSLILRGMTAYGEAPSEHVVFCRPNNMISALPYIADFKGFFNAEGLEVEFQTATNAKICNDSLIAGRVDFANGGDGPFTYVAIHNPPLVLLAFTQKNPELSVFARRDRGISRPRDLVGKKVGYLPGTVSYFYLARLLDKHKLARKDLHLTPMQSPTMTQGLIGGTIDAFVMWEPWGTNAMRQLADNGIELRDNSIYRYHGLLITSRTLTARRPQVIYGVLRAFLKAEDFIRSNPEDSLTLLSKAIPFDRQVLERLWLQYDHTVRLDEETIKILEDNIHWLQNWDNQYERISMPDFRGFVDARFLKAIASERVSGGF